MRSENGHPSPVPPPQPVLQRTRPGLGTYVTIGVSGLIEAEAEAALERWFAAMSRVDAAMSFHSADSDLARLHAAPVGAAVEVGAGFSVSRPGRKLPASQPATLGLSWPSARPRA